MAKDREKMLLTAQPAKMLLFNKAPLANKFATGQKKCIKTLQ